MGHEPNPETRLERLRRRAALALVWEAVWPPLANAGVVVLLFAAVSWFGLWFETPPYARLVGLVAFGLAVLAALFPLLRLRWPDRSRALARLDRDAPVAHRPASGLQDDLANPDDDSATRALWAVHKARLAGEVERLAVAPPSPNLAARDPYALRFVAILLALVGAFAAGSERFARLAAAFNGMPALAETASARVDAWIDPPAYTGKPPIFLKVDDASAKTIAAPEDSVLVVRADPKAVTVKVSGGLAAIPDKTDGERRFAVRADGSATLYQGAAAAGEIAIKVGAKTKPSIRLLDPPQNNIAGSLTLHYMIEDAYGVREAGGGFVLAKPAPDAPKHTLFGPPTLALQLPGGANRTGEARSTVDLSEHPWAGAHVLMTLKAVSVSDASAESPPVEIVLPQRHFVNPLAKALVEQRRGLIIDPDRNRSRLAKALDALMIAPELFMPETGQYLGVYSVARQLEAARTDDAMREVVASLWSLAVTIEDGDITDVDKALRAAQDALKQALERGASDEEIKKLTQDLRAALDNFMRQLAEQQRNNPQALARPLDPNTKVMRQQDLNNMIERMERLSRSGDKDAAKQLLEQLQEMLENLQMAQPGQSGDGDMEQALNELGDMIRKQQQLRDKTFKQGQDSRRDRAHGKQGEQGMGDLQQDQQGLRDRLKKLQQELAKRGMGQQGQQGQQGQRGEKGQKGQDGDQQQGDGEDGLGEADSAMDDAGSKLGEGNADGAVDSQGQALEAMRKGAQKLAEGMQPGDGDGQGDGPGNRTGRQQNGGNTNDPLGRPLHGREFGDDLTVKIPGEIDVQRVRRILEELRRRLADPQRPQIELDYIERLLKDY